MIDNVYIVPVVIYGYNYNRKLENLLNQDEKIFFMKNVRQKLLFCLLCTKSGTGLVPVPILDLEYKFMFKNRTRTKRTVKSMGSNQICQNMILNI